MPHSVIWQQPEASSEPAVASNAQCPPALPIHDIRHPSPAPVQPVRPVDHLSRAQSQQSKLARIAMTTTASNRYNDDQATKKNKKELEDTSIATQGLETTDKETLREYGGGQDENVSNQRSESCQARDRPPAVTAAKPATSSMAAALNGLIPEATGITVALNDTPANTAPNSPKIPALRQMSAASTPRIRPTTLDIPGLTKSKVSPDGRIAQRDVGAKLVIVMVGLPARGKSYITKKLARYLNWLQHDTRIFNVGERRRLAAGGHHPPERQRDNTAQDSVLPPAAVLEDLSLTAKTPVANIVLNGITKLEPPATPPATIARLQLPPSASFAEHDKPDNECRSDGAAAVPTLDRGDSQTMDQSANFFDPENKEASLLREQVALETLDELLDYVLLESGSIGILDATNSTIKRRETVIKHIRERAGPELNVLFLESQCLDQDLLEANMRLKLNGPDYKDMDPTIALDDFRKRVAVYEKAYVPLGDYEESQNWPYIKMIDVGRKVISHQIRGFLSAQANYYLLNFNLAPRQIWITRHGLSLDNVSGKLGGDSDLAEEGIAYARSLTRFIDQKKQDWETKQIEALRNTHFPPRPGDATPPNPHYSPQSPKLTNATPSAQELLDAATEADEELPPGYSPKAFCVWTSMLKRSIQTAQFFNDEEYDTKQMRMLDELNAGVMEGLTYNSILTKYPEEYRARKTDKLHYRYPGPGGEGYLDIINRLRPVIVELERMTDHVLLVGHRSVARVLLAYFRGLGREEVADLDVPIGLLYCLEPKPYGVDFKAYQWDKREEWFEEVPNFRLKRAEDDML